MIRTNNFDGIRIIAASMVIIGHGYALTGLGVPPVIWQSSIHTLAVEIFFAISGYLVVKSFFYDPNFIRFLAKRSLRIFPALIVVTVLTACVLGPLVTTVPIKDYFASPLFTGYFESITLRIHFYLPGVFESNPHSAINGSLWSLTAEFLMYLSVMLVGAGSLAALRKNRIAFELLWTFFTVGLIIGFICIVRLKMDGEESVFLFNRIHLIYLLPVAPFFGIGGMVFIAERYTTRQIPVIVLIGMAVLLQIYQSPTLKIVAFIFIPIIIIRVGQASWPVMRDLGRWGDLSYGTYLYGYPVAQVLILYYLTTLPLFAHIILALLISYVLAFGSWHLVEKRALRFKPKRAVDPAQQAQTN